MFIYIPEQYMLVVITKLTLSYERGVENRTPMKQAVELQPELYSL